MKVNGSTILAHRHYYEKTYGPIPEGQPLDHLCRVRRCVNPQHLRLATPLLNARHRPEYNKLDVEKAKRIRELKETGRYTQRQIAKMFGISDALVSLVIKCHIWN